MGLGGWGGGGLEGEVKGKRGTEAGGWVNNDRGMERVKRWSGAKRTTRRRKRRR